MKRKFSFDVSKLRIGISKQETKALEQHLASKQSFDSEPPTPKSVRPPLPSKAEAELLHACTYVVQTYKPSHLRFDDDDDQQDATQQLDYAAINESVRREQNTEPAQVVQWPKLPQETMRPQSVSQWPSSDAFRYKPTETSKDFLHDDDFEAMRAQRNSIMDRAEELMSNMEETQKVLLSPDIRHSRNVSSLSTASLPKVIVNKKSKDIVGPRSESVETVDSAPLTDTTDSAWASSTAPTTAPVTPATQSKRTSSNTRSETHLPPKVTAVDAEWMRHELEKHLKAQEEQAMRPESLVKTIGTGMAESTPTQDEPSPTSPHSIRRKPIPRRGTGDSKPNFSLRCDNRRSRPHSRTMSRQSDHTNSAEAQQGASQQQARAAAAKHKLIAQHQVKQVAQESKDGIRPGTAQTAIKPNEQASRPESRSRIFRVATQDRGGPTMRGSSRSPSVDVSRSGSRGRSIDSFRSAVSAISSSAESTSKRWRAWRPRQRSRDSETSLDSSRPTTSTAVRFQPYIVAPPTRPPPPKPKINLNRELPPLPSLDQWKPEETEVTIGEEEVEVPASKLQSYPVRKDSLRNRRGRGAVKHQPSASSPSFPVLQTSKSDYFTSEPSQYYNQHSASTTAADRSSVEARSSGTGPESRECHRRSKAVLEAMSQEFVDQMAATSLARSTTDQPLPVRQLASTTSIPTTAAENSRKVSSSADAVNFSRKISSDDYNRMYDQRYQNMLEVTSSSGSGSSGGKGARAVSPKEVEKAKKKWWRGKPKKQESWMDTVVKSGSRSGVLLTDEVAGAPIVRY